MRINVIWKIKYALLIQSKKTLNLKNCLREFVNTFITLSKYLLEKLLSMGAVVLRDSWSDTRPTTMLSVSVLMNAAIRKHLISLEHTLTKMTAF